VPKAKDYSMTATSDLVQNFAKMASDRGSALRVAAPRKANALYRQMVEIYRELRRRGKEAQVQMLPLLRDENTDIRISVACFALEFEPEDASAVLEKIEREERNLLGFTAEMVLKQWKEGKIRFP
jgi:hypothetical protein